MRISLWWDGEHITDFYGEAPHVGELVSLRTAEMFAAKAYLQGVHIINGGKTAPHIEERATFLDRVRSQGVFKVKQRVFSGMFYANDIEAMRVLQDRFPQDRDRNAGSYSVEIHLEPASLEGDD